VTPAHVQWCSEEGELVVQDASAPVGSESAAFTASSASASAPAAPAPAARARSSARARIGLRFFLGRGGGGEEAHRTHHTTHSARRALALAPAVVLLV
jgi:hypothetical protein